MSLKVNGSVVPAAAGVSRALLYGMSCRPGIGLAVTVVFSSGSKAPPERIGDETLRAVPELRDLAMVPVASSGGTLEVSPAALADRDRSVRIVDVRTRAELDQAAPQRTGIK